MKIKQGERKISHESACSVYMTAFNLLKNASLGCKQSCSILRYTSNVIQENENKKRWITFRYEFPMPMRTILYEEYVIMDLMNVVGVIGGTFGMFIGLDFSGIIDILRDYFRRRMPWCRYVLPEKCFHGASMLCKIYIFAYHQSSHKSVLGTIIKYEF